MDEKLRFGNGHQTKLWRIRLAEDNKPRRFISLYEFAVMVGH